ncbi:MAG: oxidoreductase [Acidobacteria bacterium]|nr:MAG: oxidoreductase [Acidobacteriota bacterium]
MENRQGINRREFIQRTTAMGLAVGASNVAFTEGPRSVNDKITVGMIGVGARAHELLQAIQAAPGTEIVGVCDAYKGRLERAVERTGGRARIYPDYREILADKGIDTVFIATPDHWHKTMAVDALEAGKDVYIEKPLTYAIEEGPAIIAGVRKTNRILQVGSQGISTKVQHKAKEVIQSGKLGQVTMIRASYNRNSAGGAWIYPIPPDASPQTVDWERFLGPAPKRPYDPARFFRWRCYWDYSGGNSTDLFVHLMTTIHFLMNAKAPQTTVAHGALYRWKDSRDVPDTINAILEYSEGFMVTLSSTFNNQGTSEGGFQILGTEGSLILGDNSLTFHPENVHEDNRWIVESWPRALEEAYYKDPKVRKAEVPSSWEPKVNQGMERWEEEGKESTLVHVEHFFDCVRTRKQPVEDALTGHRAAAVAHLVNLSYKQKKMVHWDFARETVKA